MSNPQQQRELRKMEKDIQFLVEADWQLLPDDLRQELNAIIESADRLGHEEFKRRLQLFSDRLIAPEGSA